MRSWATAKPPRCLVAKARLTGCAGRASTTPPAFQRCSARQRTGSGRWRRPRPSRNAAAATRTIRSSWRRISKPPKGLSASSISCRCGRRASALVRIVVGLRGTVRMRCLLRLRFDYGVLPPWSEARGDEMVAKVGPDLVVLRAPVKLAVHADATSAEFEVQAGERRAFVLSYGASHEPLPEPFDVDAALAATQNFWRGWISHFDNSKTAWPTVGTPVADHAEGADPCAHRRACGRTHDVVAGGARRQNELGLSLLLVARRQLHAVRPAERRVSYRSEGVAGLAAAGHRGKPRNICASCTGSTAPGI